MGIDAKQAVQAIARGDAADVDFVALAVLLAKWLGIGFAIAIVSLSGWCVSSIKVLAGWDESAEKKLEIVQGILASLAAGSLAALAGIYYQWPLVLIVAATFFGGYSGDRWLRQVAEALLSRVLSALSAIFGIQTKPPGDGK